MLTQSETDQKKKQNEEGYAKERAGSKTNNENDDIDYDTKWFRVVINVYLNNNHPH